MVFEFDWVNDSVLKSQSCLRQKYGYDVVMIRVQCAVSPFECSRVSRHCLNGHLCAFVCSFVCSECMHDLAFACLPVCLCVHDWARVFVWASENVKGTEKWVQLAWRSGWRQSTDRCREDPVSAWLKCITCHFIRHLLHFYWQLKCWIPKAGYLCDFRDTAPVQKCFSFSTGFKIYCK